MNLRIFVLLLLTIGYTLPSLSGVGGSSGGGKYMMVEVCGGESGEECKLVKIKNRFTEQDKINAKNYKGDCLMAIGDAQMVPCNDEIKNQVPNILEVLSNSYPYSEGPY